MIDRWTLADKGEEKGEKRRGSSGVLIFLVSEIKAVGTLGAAGTAHAKESMLKMLEIKREVKTDSDGGRTDEVR